MVESRAMGTLLLYLENVSEVLLSDTSIAMLV